MAKRQETFGPVLGRRRLTANGPRRHLTVTLGTPRPSAFKGEWECPFRLSAGGVRRLEYGRGVDPIQSLLSALEGIRVLLDETGLNWSWLGLIGGTGFPRMLPMLADRAVTRRLERLVDRELKAYVATLVRRHRHLAHSKPAQAATRTKAITDPGRRSL